MLVRFEGLTALSGVQKRAGFYYLSTSDPFFKKESTFSVRGKRVNSSRLPVPLIGPVKWTADININYCAIIHIHLIKQTFVFLGSILEQHFSCLSILQLLPQQQQCPLFVLIQCTCRICNNLPHMHKYQAEVFISRDFLIYLPRMVNCFRNLFSVWLTL